MGPYLATFRSRLHGSELRVTFAMQSNSTVSFSFIAQLAAAMGNRPIRDGIRSYETTQVPLRLR